MYASTADVSFRNPFDSTNHIHEPTWSQATSSRQSRSLYAPSRPPTPPPEMQSVRHESSTDSYTASYAQDSRYPQLNPQEKVLRSPVSRAVEPVTETVKPSNGIAPSFQIPRTVNDSGGSLSELAAQITCFFWFESPELLDKIETSTLPVQPSAPLTRDAIPTTGFRKWVTTILSTTLVGANVVLLALLFIHRLKKLNPSVRGKSGSEYRLLTVALMLGNKFLDDNTYTNKTWAEVSGIMVSEVHVMEVEFLSNMKYCLYTSSEDWMEWQTLLGRYAAYFERASNPVPQRSMAPAPILPPASSLRIPMALPSPPASTQASPPYAIEGYPSNTPNGPTPAPSPLALAPVGGSSSRKRSLDDRAHEPAAKRLQQATPDTSFSSASSFADRRPTLPMPIPAGNDLAYPALPSTFQQLPPLTVPARAMSMVYTNNITSTTMSLHSAGKTQTMPLPPHLTQSRQLSPCTPLSAASSAHDLGSTALHPLHHGPDLSPSHFLKQRSSPYRPVHNVSTLLYPPPSAALHQRRTNIDQHQMHYQPLSKAAPLQSGHLPYISQHTWTDNQHHPTTMQQWQVPAQYQRHPLPHPGI